ncbi:hypothetical protein B0I37DRAFT_379769 [Chaetomium sp. MPI-CAGE-AT-0009]|nr:hypothetical protein B0I37DRAFT_379769 [Chaetomium sp. MPI-CAGE-AT-0009]
MGVKPRVTSRLVHAFSILFSVTGTKPDVDCEGKLAAKHSKILVVRPTFTCPPDSESPTFGGQLKRAAKTES